MGDSEIDQLFRIFRALGTPTEDDWPGLEQMPDYKPTFPCWHGIDLRQKIPASVMDDQGMDLLMKTIIYDPVERISTKDLLHHPYFDNVDIRKIPAGNYRGELSLKMNYLPPLPGASYELV